MKVKFKVHMSGVDHTWEVGQVADVDTAEAKRLVEAGFAEATDAPLTPVTKGREKAVARTKVEKRSRA